MTELLELYRNSVQQWEIDMMGHMNVQFYVEKSTAGLSVLAHHLGMGPAFCREAGAVLVPVEHHVRFLQEQRPGAPIVLRGGVVDSDHQTLRIYQELVNAASGNVVATFLVTAGLRGARDAEMRALPAEALERAAGLKVPVPEYGAPRGLVLDPPRTAPTMEEAESGGMLATWRGPVLPRMLDEYGFMATHAHMGIVSDAIPNLLVHLTREDRAESGIGGAALEYRFVYRHASRGGDLLTLYSGIKAVSSKTYQFGHWLFDAVSGEVVATAEAVAVMLDMNTRRAMVIPDDRRAVLDEHVVPGLSA